MATVILTINMDKSAFDPGQGLEVARILNSVAGSIKETYSLVDIDANLYDANGNTVGKIIGVA